MADTPKRLPAFFYRTAGGREPVREWLRSLEMDDRKIIGEDIKDVEFSWPIGMPLVRPLGRELWEVRSSLTAGKIGRVIFSVGGTVTWFWPIRFHGLARNYSSKTR